MWWLWASLGAAVWMATILSSAAMNYIAGFELGRSVEEARIFGMLGVSADVWKAIGPIFIATLFKARKLAGAALASAVWIICFAVAVSAAIGLAAKSRGAVVGGQETIRVQYRAVVYELAEVERQRRVLGDVTSPAEREAAIGVELAQPLPGGSVGSLSDGCSKDHWRSRSGCAKVAELRRELARSVEGKRLDERIALLRDDREALLKRGATGDVDPQATLISRVTFGRVRVADVGLVMTLLLVMMVELVSAFTPVIVREFSSIDQRASRRVAARPARSRSVARNARSIGREERRLLAPPIQGEIFDYMAERVVPDPSGELAVDLLFNDYASWCTRTSRQAMSKDAFASALESVAARELKGSIVCHGGVCLGLRIVDHD